MGNNVSWDHLPFYRALTEYILVLGTPRNVIIMNGFITFMFVMYFHFLYIIVLTVVVHCACVYISKDDAQFFDCAGRYFSKKNYYST